MKKNIYNSGSVMLTAVFAIALLSALVIGILQMNTEEIQLMQNQIYAAQARAVAEAGLNDAFSEIRDDSTWTAGFTDKSFNGGEYDVTVSGTLPFLTITSTGTTAQNFTARVEADIAVGVTNPYSTGPYVIRIDKLRVNE